MGYTTEFTGNLTLNKRLTEEDSKFLKDFNSTRRMKRNLEGYGIDGEFFVGNLNDHGQDHSPDVIDYNCPPSTQPSLWCNWVPTEDDMGLEWDSGEKAYCMEQWIVYLINRYLEPRGYVVNGDVEAEGEERGDNWTIKVVNNVVKVSRDNLTRTKSTYTEVKFSKAPKLPSLVKEEPKKNSSWFRSKWIDPSKKHESSMRSKLELSENDSDTKTLEKGDLIKIQCRRNNGDGSLWIDQKSIIDYLNSQLKTMGKPSAENASVRVILKHLIQQFKSL